MTENLQNSRRTFIGSLLTSGVLLAGDPVESVSTNLDKSMENSNAPNDKLILGMVVFDRFQLLDTFGPLEMFGSLKDKVTIVMIGQKQGLARSSAGPAVAIDYTFENAPKLDIVMIPGGGGTRVEVNNTHFVNALKMLAEQAPHVASICTGAAVLARTGLLDGKNATTNKRAFHWVETQGQQVNWVKKARWVEDGKYFTSSGISAGTDMSLALIAKLFGEDVAVGIANGAEYEWNKDSQHDPFAKLNGLVD
ncbi:DJ-1/PfpI family protein [Dyadobacter chenhuakuii]|uniref:DJ-1/PfpI family protein n=1 Tax=Dyadobacter chenhuakuii TaxID=2909339 RepID=A0A9X1QGW7_9BACT|nr:DJ-1/PfpI family protein [Dyadobacter chenhuakuii]MCF2501316.1 DJ-1/PfpI family protein [Dyadobacter chenhuakuii]